MNTTNYIQRGKTIIVSVVASTFLIGCGGNGGDTTTTTGVTVAGVASDPELQGATVFLDANSNGIMDNNELNTTTNNLGEYSLTIPQADAGKPIVVIGGIDRVTKAPFTGKLSTIATTGSNSQHITPLTTLVQKLKAANSNKTLDDIKTEVAKKLGLSVNNLDEDTTKDARLLKVALRIHKVAQKIANTNGKNIDEIYAVIATKLTESTNLNSTLNKTITQEVDAGTLDEAKVRDLDQELARVDDTKSVDALALTVENVNTTVETATTTTELDTDLSQDTTVVVDDGEVETEKGKRTLDTLGLGKLDPQTKDKIVKSDKIDFDRDSIEDIRKKIDTNDVNLTQDEQKKVKQEQFLNTNGLEDLDTDSRKKLSDNFDFQNGSEQDFQEKLRNGDLFKYQSGGIDTGLKDKIERLQNQKAQREKLQQQQNSTTKASLADGKVIVGSIIKGPINGATMTLKDANGATLTSTISEKGIFVFPEQNLTSEYYTIESTGGSYDDEATKKLVQIGAAQGLKTLFTKEELQSILTNKEYIAITPETTIYTEIVLDDVKNSGMGLADAMTEAKTLITDAMIKDSSPLTILPGDKFLQTGDFTTSFPKDQSEAFARNRAISFSYMVHNLGLNASDVFKVMDLVIEDYKDGSADGIQLADERDVNVTQEFALARTKLFQDTTGKLRSGDLSEGQKAQLKEMGFDTEKFGANKATADANLSALEQKALNLTTLPTLHVLPVLADEDGNTTDAKETYTLKATEGVNVVIETPEGNWTTPMWRYNNNPLPVVIHAKRGDAMTLNFDNNLSADSTIHWHGFQIPAIMDGGPDMPVAPNTSKAYTFTMNQPAAPLWFHPHPDMQTGKQVYMGLAGVYLLSDDITKQLEDTKQIPSGAKDTVLLVQDRRFANLNTSTNVRELQYKTMQMDSDGMLGDTVLVNGSVLPKQEVSNTLHRYRLYNVSNARNYDFALSDDSDFTVIGTDGGLLERPVSVNHIVLGAAERVEIVVDFSKYSVGDKVLLVSKPFSGDMMSMMSSNNGSSPMSSMGGNNGSSPTSSMGYNNSSSFMTSGTDTLGMTGMLANGTGLTIMRFDVTSTETEDVTLYDTLSFAAIATRLSESDAINQGNERQFVMSMGGMNQAGMNQAGMGQDGMGQQQSSNSGMNGMSFVINGQAFDMTKVNEFVPAGATEIWSISNMSPMAHPFHAHAIQYQVLTRNGKPATGTDLGWKDTFLVQPGETVRVIGDFSSAEGDYMYHCHILEHEDAGMMGYFRVGDTGNLGAQ